MRTGPTNKENGSVHDTGLILTGGGARAAYQVGVLSALMEIIEKDSGTECVMPFSIICGSSAGAINAASLASHASDPKHGINRLEQLWSSLRTEMVYASDAISLMQTGSRWLGVLALGWVFPSLRKQKPYSLLDNGPLRTLLSSTISFDQIKQNLDSGYLGALAITATAYNTGEHLTFYQSEITIKPWQRSSRKAIPCDIGIDHLMASSAIPFVFPAEVIKVGSQAHWCGDGSMRQLAPMSPAIHLGASRIMVIGTAYDDEIHPDHAHSESEYPSLAQIGGHVLSNIFIDSLAMDIERMSRINELLAKMPADGLKSQSLRPVQSLVITPSESLDLLALKHVSDMPRAARTLFRAIGVSPKSVRPTGGALISYLLFEASYTQALISLGRKDCFNRSQEVKDFFKESS